MINALFLLRGGSRRVISYTWSIASCTHFPLRYRIIIRVLPFVRYGDVLVILSIFPKSAFSIEYTDPLIMRLKIKRIKKAIGQI
ncbi:hypothetical protein [Anaplasma phagocytophilum]|uniref:hypothetical protein n=1 Tax=Anaplasma phagocytophilum TaxID=948 RepID=UPI000A5AE29B|nr:hypothetical protein [Anaplasma phagocytophilum]